MITQTYKNINYIPYRWSTIFSRTDTIIIFLWEILIHIFRSRKQNEAAKQT